MLITQKIQSLLNGVSQQPAPQRLESQAEAQDNMWSSPTLGLRKRPPTEQVALLDAVPTGYDQAFVHMVNRSATDRYAVVVANNTVQVFDAVSGAAQTVAAPKGFGYLAGPFKATTIGDYTVIASTSTVVTQGTATAPPVVYEALLFVRQADYSTPYTVTLDDTTVSITTVGDATAAGRAGISTDAIAADLMAALLAETQIASDYTLTRTGATIHVVRKDGRDFTLTTTDGLADKGLRAVKGSVQVIADLPTRAKNGMVVKVAGDPGTKTDDYWVQYSDQGTPQEDGVWQECPAPGTPLDLDATTMPWALIRNGPYVSGVEHQAAPALPTVSLGPTTTYTDGFTVDPDTLAPLDPGADTVLQNHNQGAQGTLTNATGETRSLQVAYDVDTAVMEPGTSVTVQLATDAGGTMTPVATRVYPSGLSLRNEQLAIPTALPANTKVEVRLLDFRKATPQTYRRATLTLHKLDHPDGPGLSHVAHSSRRVAFVPTAVYPAGTQVTLSVTPAGGATTDFTYTVQNTDGTGASVATALIPLVDADPALTATADGSGRLLVASAVPGPAVTARVELPPATTFWNAGMAMVAGEHVGRTILNITDGSSGTITSNGTTTIVTSALSGGTDNQFQPGDRIEVRGTGTYYVFDTLPWSRRTAGDMTSVPMPGFVGKTIDELFFYQNRLGFTSAERVLLSESGNLFNFFRSTATDVLATDSIDIRSAYKDVALFTDAVEWSGQLWLFTPSGHQFALSGDPVLTPTTVRLDHKGSYPYSAGVRPVVLGDQLYFTRALDGYTRLMLGVLDQYRNFSAQDATAHVPTYIQGAPTRLTGDAGQGILFVQTDAAPGTLWVYVSQVAGGRLVQASWSRWLFGGVTAIPGMDMLDGTVVLVVSRSDGVFLERIRLGNPVGPLGDHRDRQGNAAPVSYTALYRPSAVYMRDASSGVAQTAGRLQLRTLSVFYHATADFTVSVSPPGRPTKQYVFTSPTPAAGVFRVPVLARNDGGVMIELTSATATGCAFSGLEWEGTLSIRSRPV